MFKMVLFSGRSICARLAFKRNEFETLFIPPEVWLMVLRYLPSDMFFKLTSLGLAPASVKGMCLLQFPSPDPQHDSIVRYTMKSLNRGEKKWAVERYIYIHGVYTYRMHEEHTWTKGERGDVGTIITSRAFCIIRPSLPHRIQVSAAFTVIFMDRGQRYWKRVAKGKFVMKDHILWDDVD